MEREMEYLLRLLRGFLWNIPIEKDENVKWVRLQELAAIHGVSGILGYMSMANPIAPENLRSGLRQDCIQTMALYNRRAVLAEEFVSALADLGVDVCAMKGMVVRRLYPVPELRTFNDVDVLIHREDRQKTHAYLLKQGFEPKDDWEPIYSYTKAEQYYELHAQLIEVDVTDRADYRGFFDEVWTHTVETAPHRYEMEKEFQLLYLLTHIAKHVAGSGAGVRMYLDIAAYLKAYNATLDWAKIIAWLEEIKLSRFGCAVLTAVESWFGASCNAPFERLSQEALERFAQFTLEAGTFGNYGRDSALAKLKRNEGSRLGLLLKRAFPCVENLEKRYTYLQTKPWLLPVAWVHRLFKTGGSLKKHTREAVGIMTIDPKDTQRLKEICKEIGL